MSKKNHNDGLEVGKFVRVKVKMRKRQVRGKITYLDDKCVHVQIYAPAVHDWFVRLGEATQEIYKAKRKHCTLICKPQR